MSTQIFKNLMAFFGLILLVGVFMSLTTETKRLNNNLPVEDVVFTPVQMYGTDTVDWYIRDVDDLYTIKGHFEQVGDNATTTLDIYGSNFAPQQNLWAAILVDSSMAGAAAEYIWDVTTGANYKNYWIRLISADTTKVYGNVRLAKR